jgi:hypothetical protein
MKIQMIGSYRKDAKKHRKKSSRLGLEYPKIINRPKFNKYSIQNSGKKIK